MSRYERLLPEITGTLAIVTHCFVVYWSIDGTLPVWSTVFVGVAVIPLVLWRAERTGTSSQFFFGVTRSVLVALPAAIVLVLLSGLGRMIRALRVFGRNPFDRMHPTEHVRQTTVTPTTDGSVPYSLLFSDYFTGELTAVEETFASLVFDPYLLLVAIESTVLFAVGGAVGTAVYVWRAR